MPTDRSDASFIDETTFQRVSASWKFTPRFVLRARGLLVLGEREVDGPAVARHLPLGEGEVGLPDALAGRERLAERHHRLARLRDEHDAGGVAVEAVRRRGAELGRREVGGDAEVAARELDERRARDAGAGVGGDAGRLVDGEDVVVLVEHAEARAARPRRRRPGRRRLRREEPLLVPADRDGVPLLDELLGPARARRSLAPCGCGTSCRRARAARRAATCERACRAAGRPRRPRP